MRMKKTLLLLTAALLGSAAVNAQVKKSWDFTKGLSDETIANLNADNANWASNGTDAEGNTNNWQNSTKPSTTEYLKANGQVIPELEGLLFDIGSNKANSIHVATTKLRLTRKNTKITFPKLANGQKVTIVGRSANGTATNRGIAPVQDYLKLVEGETTGGACIFVGNGVDGSLGTYSFTWEVQTDATDSVDVAFTLTPDGGIDFTLFQIDNGDVPAIEEDPNVVYIYSGDIDEDAFRQYAGLDDYSTVTNIPVSELLDGTVTPDSLMTYDVAILAKSGFEVEGAVDFLKEGLNYVPMLNLWPAEALGYIPANVATPILTVGEDYLDADIFAELEMGGDNGDELVMFNGESGVLGYTLAEGSEFADDEVYAKAGEADAIHLHAKRNTYMLLPIDPEQMLADGDLNMTDAGIALVSNAVKYLRSTKVNVVDAPKPAVSYLYEDGKTTVTLSSNLAGAKIYYTVDGTRPTVENSPVYKEPLVFTEPATLMAKVKAPSYNSSPVIEEQVIVKTQLGTPSISVAQGEGSSTITLSSSSADASLYYSFNGQKQADRATLYSEPIVITEPGTITAFAYADGYLTSEVAVSDVFVAGIPAVKDTLAHFNAGTTDWFDNALLYDAEGNEIPTPTENWTAKTAYYFGKNAWEYYSTEVDRVETVTDAEGNVIKSQIPGQENRDSTVTYYKPDPAAFRSIKSATDTKWVISTQGQLLTGETNIDQLGYVKTEGASDGRYHDEAIDLIGGPATKGCLTMGGKNSGNPYTAAVTTLDKYAAPFDVVVYANQGNSDGATVNVEIQVSADGETWTSIGDVKMAYTMRHIKKTRLHYSTAGEVYVRLAQVGGKPKAQICDIYVISTDGLTGIRAIEETAPVRKSDVIYNILGQKVGKDYKGLIIRDGKKIINK